MDNDEIEKLKLFIIRDYEEMARVVAGLLDVDLEVAREAIHTVVCKIMTGLKERPGRSVARSWRPYVVQAAINELRSDHRGKEKTVFFSDLAPDDQGGLVQLDSHEPTPAKKAEVNELAALAWSFLAKLPGQEREVITRRCQGGTYGEIARALGIDPVTARVHFHNGIRELRQRLEAVEGFGRLLLMRRNAPWKESA